MYSYYETESQKSQKTLRNQRVIYMLFILIVVMISWVQREKFCKNPGREVANTLYEMERNMDNLEIMQPVVGSNFFFFFFWAG